MKHLKAYNESTHKLSEDIKQDLKDICIELEDKRFIIWYHLEDYFSPSLRILHERTQYFEYDDVKEVIERIEDFMKNKGYEINVMTLTDNYNMQLLIWGIDVIFMKMKCNEGKFGSNIDPNKSYPIGYIPDEIKQDIKDIFLELQDSKFIVNFSNDKFKFNTNTGYWSSYSVFITQPPFGDCVGYTTLGDISEYILRLQDYIKEFNYKLAYNVVSPHISIECEPIDKLFKLSSDARIYGITIHIYNI